jgi:hypothetical protein
MKIRPVEAVLLYQDGRTDGKADRQKDVTTLIVIFRNSVNASNKIKQVYKYINKVLIN